MSKGGRRGHSVLWTGALCVPLCLCTSYATVGQVCPCTRCEERETLSQSTALRCSRDGVARAVLCLSFPPPPLLSHSRETAFPIGYTLRGTGADIIVLEEAAYIDERVFFQVVVALLEMLYSLLFAISTPADEYNYYSKLVRLVDPKTGKHVFNVIHKTLVCAKCRKNGLKDDCKHMKGARPAWKNENTDLIKLIMGTRTADFDREIGAEITGASNSAFSPQLMNELKHAPRRTGPIKGSPIIYVGIDASGDTANENSEFAMVSVVHDPATGVGIVRFTLRDRERERESVCVCVSVNVCVFRELSDGWRRGWVRRRGGDCSCTRSTCAPSTRTSVDLQYTFQPR